MNKIFITLLLIITISCKNDKTNKEIVDKTNQVAQNDFFSVAIDLIAQKEDSFHVYYTEDGSINFTEENSVWVEFKGSVESQKLVFNLPKEVVPTQLRIDFGLNTEQSDIRINSLEMAYFDKKVTLTGSEFFKCFRPNEETTIFDIPNLSIKKINKKGITIPQVYPTELLTNKITEIIN